MKKTEIKEIKFEKDQYGMMMYPMEYSLSMIANMLSNFEHGISRLAVDNNVAEDIYLPSVEKELENLKYGIAGIEASLADIHSTAIDTNSNLELIVMQLSRIADSLEKNNKK